MVQLIGFFLNGGQPRHWTTSLGSSRSKIPMLMSMEVRHQWKRTNTPQNCGEPKIFRPAAPPLNWTPLKSATSGIALGSQGSGPINGNLVMLFNGIFGCFPVGDVFSAARGERCMLLNRQDMSIACGKLLATARTSRPPGRRRALATRLRTWLYRPASCGGVATGYRYRLLIVANPPETSRQSVVGSGTSVAMNISSAP